VRGAWGIASSVSGGAGRKAEEDSELAEDCDGGPAE